MLFEKHSGVFGLTTSGKNVAINITIMRCELEGKTVERDRERDEGTDCQIVKWKQVAEQICLVCILKIPSCRMF